MRFGALGSASAAAALLVALAGRAHGDDPAARAEAAAGRAEAAAARAESAATRTEEAIERL